MLDSDFPTLSLHLRFVLMTTPEILIWGSHQRSALDSVVIALV
jgi:hypothetical protein